jgi:hypothetical protein
MPEIIPAELAPFVEAPPARWDAMTGRFLELGPSSRSDPTRDLDGAAERLALAAGYFGGRAMGMDHHAARNRADHAVKALRKALGYSYP